MNKKRDAADTFISVAVVLTLLLFLKQKPLQSYFALKGLLLVSIKSNKTLKIIMAIK